MKKIIVYLITFSTAFSLYGMDPWQERDDLLSRVTRGVLSVVTFAFEETSAEQIRREIQLAKMLKQEQQERAKMGQETPEKAHRAISSKPQYPFTRVYESINTFPGGILNFLRRVLILPLQVFWGKALVYGIHPYIYNRSSNDLMKEGNVATAQKLFAEQAKEEDSARCFQAKHSLAWGALAAVMSAGIACHKYGCNGGKTAQIGSCIGLTASLLSWCIFGHRTRINDIKDHQKTRIMELSTLPLSHLEADEAYERTMGKGFLSGLQTKGFWGSYSVYAMRNAVKKNFSLTTRVIQVPTAQEN